MILLKNIVYKILSEAFTFRDLWQTSDPARVDRSKHVNTKSLGVKTMDENEAWTFSYKSSPGHSTTGNRWRGYVKFLKENVKNANSAEDIPCMADCSCPDYRYRWAYNNSRVGSSPIGINSLNKNNGAKPTPPNDLGPGLCKHLLALGEYLKTKIEPTVPENPEETKPKIVKKSKVHIAPKKKTKTNPGFVPKPPDEENPELPEEPIEPEETPQEEPEDNELLESKSNLFDRFENFVKSYPQFEIHYED